MRKWMLALALIFATSLSADDQELRRVLIGTRIFGATLAAVQSPPKPDSVRRIAVIYREHRDIADEVVQRLKSLQLRSGPLLPYPYRFDAVPATGDFEAVFLSEWLPSLDELTAWADAHQILVFSPLLGDVERGAHAGLYVTDRILPLVNVPALRAAQIHLKPFFLEVAHRHGD